MLRLFLAYVLLIFAPAAILAVLAFRVADRDYVEMLESYQVRLENAADDYCRRFEEAVADGFAEAEAVFCDWEDLLPGTTDGVWFEQVVGFAHEGDWLGFHLGKALDRASFASTSETVRRDLAAAAALVERNPADSEARSKARSSLRDLFRRYHPFLSADVLDELVSNWTDEPWLQKIVDGRRDLKEFVDSHPEVLNTGQAVLREDSLLRARELSKPELSRPIRAIACLQLLLPGPIAGEFRVDVVEVDPPGAARRDYVDPSVWRVAYGEDGPPLAALRLWDPDREARLGSFEERRDLRRALVGLLVLMTLGGGVALMVFVVKQRRLAALRSRLLANVSHELKTPVTSIRMFSEMLVEDPLDEARTRHFGELLLSESLRLSRIITNLLDVTRHRGQEEELDFEPVDLTAILRRMGAAFEYHAAECGAKLHVELPTGAAAGEDASGPLVIRSDATALERILVNLLDNALKYGGGERPEVRLRVKVEPERVLLSVQDRGLGIPRAEHERIFEEFYRLRYEDYSVKGVGLGLAISRRLARRLGGDICVESREGGGGSTFTVILPRESVTVPERRASAPVEIRDGDESA